MISIEHIEIIAGHRGLKRLSISKNPSWVDKNHQEGLELELGTLKSFWIVAGERKYDQPTSEPLQKTINSILTSEVYNEPKTEDKTESAKEISTEKEALLPDFLTPTLMTKWALMSTTDRVLMFQKTPKDKIKSVVVGKNAKGENEFAPYVEGNYMFKEANAAFLFDWNLSDVVISVCASGVGISGKLNVWFKEYNKYISRPATGYQELNKKVDVELAKKGATTDAIKKGLSLFGFNSDVYGGEI